MRVGHGTAALPVADGTPMAGYAARTGASTGVLEPLQVDCVMLGGLPLIVAEVLEVDDALAAAVRERIPGAWVCATHTHAGPEPAALRARIAEAAAEAHAAAIEADVEARYHSGWLEGVGSPRNGGGDARVRVDVLSFAAPDGRLAGVLAVVPVHPTVLPATSTLIGGDLAGAIRAATRRQSGAPWVVVATGAAGDISTRRTRRAQTAEECRRLGEEAARQITALLRAPAGASWDAGVAAPALRRLALPARRCDPEALTAVRVALEARNARTPSRTLEVALQGVDLAASREAAGEVALALSAARLGPLSLFGVGGEPFHSLRETLPEPAVLLGYANGHAGYLPDAAAYGGSCRQGIPRNAGGPGAGYEVLASPFRADAAATVAAALNDLLPEPTEA
jgi:neutral ceramidase